MTIVLRFVIWANAGGVDFGQLTNADQYPDNCTWWHCRDLDPLNG
jgi:hypothetical protein